MKILRTAVFIFATAFPLGVFGAGFEALYNGPEFLSGITNQILMTRQVDTVSGKLQLDLCYVREQTNSPPELRLIAHDGGQSLAIWWVKVVKTCYMPEACLWNERVEAHSLGLLFHSRSRDFVFYEVDLDKAMEVAKAGGGRGLGSEWYAWSNPSGSNTAALVQFFSLTQVMNTSLVSFMGDLELNIEAGKWIMSGNLHWRPGTRHNLISLTPLFPMKDTKLFIQIPVGSKTEPSVIRSEYSTTGVAPFVIIFIVLCIGGVIFYLFKNVRKLKNRSLNVGPSNLN